MFPRLTILSSVETRVRRHLARIDPSEDPAAAPLELTAIVVVLFLAFASAAMYLRWKFHPMQDMGHHVAMTAVVADYGRAGSIYPAIYKPLDWLGANSLLYLLAGYSGKLIGVGWALRLAMAFYLAGVPIANLFALRVFERSLWGAIMAVPFAYGMCWVAGFANFVFAAPFAIVTLALHYRVLMRPTPGRVIACAIGFVLVFLAHVHVFLWFGLLCFLQTLVFVPLAIGRDSVKVRAVSPLRMALASALSTLPSLWLVSRWYRRGFGPPPTDEYLTYTDSSTFSSLSAYAKTYVELFNDFPGYLRTLKQNEGDYKVLVLSLGVLAIAVSASRLQSNRRPGVLEAATLLSLFSYFFLPENTKGQAVIGSRHISMALWLAPVFFSPVPASVSRVARYAVIAGMLLVERVHHSTWLEELRAFQEKEVGGLAQVLKAAPPRMKLQYINFVWDSPRFQWHAWWHTDTWYMADKGGQVNDNPAYGLMNPIRYRSSFKPHHIPLPGSNWPQIEDLWRYYDLVLVHSWSPTGDDLARAKEHAILLAKSGDWELWQNKNPSSD